MNHGHSGHSAGKLVAVSENRLQLFTEMGCHEDRGPQRSTGLESTRKQPRGPSSAPAFLQSHLVCTACVGQHLLAWFGKETKLSCILVNVLETVLGDEAARGLDSLLYCLCFL